MAGTTRQSWAALLEEGPLSTRYTRYNALSDLVFVGLLSLSTFLMTLLLGVPEPLVAWTVVGVPAPAFAALYAALAVGFVAVAARRWRDLDRVLRNRDRLDRSLEERSRDLAEAEAERDRMGTELERARGDLERFLHVADVDLAGRVREAHRNLGKLQERYGGSLPEEAGTWMADAGADLDRMDRVLQGVRGYASVDRGKLELTPVDLDDVVSEVVRGFDGVLKRTRGEVRWVGLPTVAADRGHMVRVFHHLIHNALRYHGDARPRVELRAHRESGRWCVEVTDRGVGIPVAERSRVFDLFVRGTAGEALAGTGVGLALCKRSMERHGGSISLESREGRGTTMTLTLPMSPKQA